MHLQAMYCLALHVFESCINGMSYFISYKFHPFMLLRFIHVSSCQSPLIFYCHGYGIPLYEYGEYTTIKHSQWTFGLYPILCYYEKNCIVLWENMCSFWGATLQSSGWLYQKTGNSRCWEECGEIGTFVRCWWTCKMVQQLWKNSMTILKNLNIELPYDPAVLLLGVRRLTGKYPAM